MALLLNKPLGGITSVACSRRSKFLVVNLLRAAQRDQCCQYFWQLRFGLRLAANASRDLRMVNGAVAVVLLP